MSRVFKMTQKAIEEKMDWDQAIYENEIETVIEGELEDLLEMSEYQDEDLYGIE